MVSLLLLCPRGRPLSVLLLRVVVDVMAAVYAVVVGFTCCGGCGCCCCCCRGCCSYPAAAVAFTIPTRARALVVAPSVIVKLLFWLCSMLLLSMS